MILKRFLLLSFCFISMSCYCNAQKLIFTSEGMRSSEDPSSEFVEYKASKDQTDFLWDYTKKKLSSGVDFFSYTIDYIGDDKIRISGYIDGASMLVFGKTEISFSLLMEFDAYKVRVGAELSKSNGKPLKYGLLFSKKTGKVRLAAPKNKIEEDINRLINKILGDAVVIQ
ncbi:MAG: hypothetical protein IJY59_10275 [Bacteroidaceae bacterium]|nr:hypothetical protein [Bacteroidaceae bacterium]